MQMNGVNLRQQWADLWTLVDITYASASIGCPITGLVKGGPLYFCVVPTLEASAYVGNTKEQTDREQRSSLFRFRTIEHQTRKAKVQFLLNERSQKSQHIVYEVGVITEIFWITAQTDLALNSEFFLYPFYESGSFE